MFFFSGYYKNGNFCFDKFTKQCRFKGNTTTTSTYTPTAEERKMWDLQNQITEEYLPNAKKLNDTAAGLLWDSIGSNQVDFNALNNRAQNQILGATNGMQGLIGSNNAATTTANNALAELAPQYSAVAGSANNALSGYQSGNTSATNNANALLGNLIPLYSDSANSTNAQLAGLANGVLPSAYQQNMQNSIASALENTMGSALNTLGQRGVINSSVMNTSMNDISKNAADTVAQQYANNINTVANLANQQLSNTNTALGQQNNIYTQQLSNTLNANTANAGLTNQQLQNANNALDYTGQASQTQLQNTLGANSTNSGLYGGLIDSASSGITTGAAAQEAAQQAALNLWNASLGLSPSGSGALNAVAGKGTTTQTQSGGSGGWLSGIGGLLSAGITAWCFAEDTLVKMADGSVKFIQDIVEGEKVACPHADGTETEETVLEVMQPHFSDVYAITAKDKDENYIVALTTSTQPLLCADGTFVTVGNLKPYKELHGGLTVMSIEYDEFCEVYDLKVSGENNYFADGFAAKGGTNEW